MDFFDVVTTQRAMRRLKPDAIADDVLSRIMDAAICAPSGGNRQNWSFVVVRDRAKRARLGEAPVIVLACVALDPGTRASLTTGASIYPAVQNIMLAARALGIGSCITTIHRFRDAQVKELLGIPADVETAALIPLGYPLGKFGRPPRRPVREVAFADRWGVAL